MRNNKPERLGGLEVDHKIKLGWLLDRNVGGLRLAQPAKLELVGPPFVVIGGLLGAARKRHTATRTASYPR